MTLYLEIQEYSSVFNYKIIFAESTIYENTIGLHSLSSALNLTFLVTVDVI